MLKRIILGFIIVFATGWALGASYFAYELNNKLEAAQNVVVESNNKYEKLNDQLTETKASLEKQNAELTATIEEQKKVLESRDNFLATLPPAREALASAENKIDVTNFKQQILDAQNVVATEKVNPTVVDEQAQKVTALTSEITAAVKTYDEEQARKQQQQQKTENTQTSRNNTGHTQPKNTNTNKNSSSGGNTNNGGSSGGGNTGPKQGSTQNYPGLEIVRQALNDVGGSWVSLGAADVVCSVDWAAACAHYGGYIEVDTQYLGNDYNWWYPIMLHEYAHQVQFIHYDKYRNASGYHNLFGSDVEWLTDCMAMSVMPNYTSGYGYSCSQEQLNYAHGGWSGNF